MSMNIILKKYIDNGCEVCLICGSDNTETEEFIHHGDELIVPHVRQVGMNLINL